ncbi:Hypothetical predicted protein [Paramuricea clavata]|uniref:Uncharacterized protein n=1 Tax=Paramuricea clavata TaxID=317549 RepID=A0A7D9JKR1_PARCT|nr:Hypothetical predicted protein [Paramuricea clavata]
MQRKEPQGSGIVKLAVKPPEASQMTPSFLHFDQTRKLQDIIDELCKGWKIPNPEQHALQYADSNTFINEQNRHELSNGAVLALGISPEMLARTLYEDIKSGDNESSKHALAKLATASEDPSFASEFINLDGLRTLLYMVEGGIE